MTPARTLMLAIGVLAAALNLRNFLRATEDEVLPKRAALLGLAGSVMLIVGAMTWENWP